MAHVVCLMSVKERSATFTWSEGPAAFEPYTLDGMDYDGKNGFKQVAESARRMLGNLSHDCLHAHDDVCRSSFELAMAGYKLHERLFPDDSRQAMIVRQWLDELSLANAVDTIEIVVDSPWALPWNVIYDRLPEMKDFVGACISLDRWKPFWGLKYNMCGGRKVDPLRRMPILRNPHVLLVIDPEVRDGLPEDQRKDLVDFINAHDYSVVHTKNELGNAIAERRPDLLYWLSHATSQSLKLSGEDVSPSDLRELLKRKVDDRVRFGGLAFLNACQTAEFGGDEGSFFEALYRAGFAGMIGTEHQTINTFANPLGLKFLKAVLDGGQSVGAALWQLRRDGVPLGLLYGTYCPPDIRVERGEIDKGITLRQLPPIAGVALGVVGTPGQFTRPSPARLPPPLPPEPYRSLTFYDRADRALLAGREDDIERFATYLDDSATRILVLHGESGVGKSSFLLAGVIPYLEEECLGYGFMHNRDANDEAGSHGSVMFIRATNDLCGQLAQVLCVFCARPYDYETPTGKRVSSDLPGVLADCFGKGAGQGTVRAMLGSDPSLLGRLLTAIDRCLPFTVVLVIDQGEEVFTLAQTPEEQQRSRQALEMLRQTTSASGDFKVIFSLRTEYFGRVIDRLRRGLHDSGGIREYLLTDFDELDLFEAIRRPTSGERIPYASEIPFDKYGFRYAPGVAEEIARRVTQYTAQRRDGVLPLMQVVCTQLFRKVRERADRTITLSDFEAIGGIEGGMHNHVECLLKELIKGHPSDRTPVQELFTQLYLKQPDGTLTTALLVESEVKERWTGSMPFDELLRLSGEMRLLKVSTLSIGMNQERRYVSLGHDALARIAADWDEQLGRVARMRKMAAAIVAVSAVALVMTFIALWTSHLKKDAVSAKRKADKEKGIAVEKTREAYRQTANALWQVAIVARDRPLGVQSAHKFLLAAQAYEQAGETVQGQNAALAAQFATSGLVRSFPNDGGIEGVGVSRDESRVLTWSNDGTIRLWDVEQRKPVQVWKHDRSVNGAMWSRDESRVLSWSGFLDSPGEVRLWDVTKSEPLRVWKHDRSVGGAVFSSDESKILAWSGGTADTPGELKLWDVTRDEPLQAWNHDRAVHGATFTRDESRVLAWSGAYKSPGEVKLWDVAATHPLQVWRHDHEVEGAVFSRDESRVLAWNGPTDKPGEVKLWDVSNAEPIQVWKHERGVNGAVFSRDDSMVLAWSGYGYGGEVKLWHADRTEPLQVWHQGLGARGAIFGRNESRILAWGGYTDRGEVWLLDASQAKPIHVWPHDSDVHGAKFSRDESRVLAWSGSLLSPGEVKLWDVRKAEPLNVLKHDGDVRGAVFSRDESRVLAWSEDGAVTVWDATKSEPLHRWKHDGGVGRAVFMRDESRVLAWNGFAADAEVKLWDMTIAEPRQVCRHDGNISGAVLAGDDARVLAWSRGANDSGEVTLWGMTDAKPLQAWKHVSVVNGAVLSRDKSRFLTWSSGTDRPAEVALWDMTKLAPLHVWKHGGRVNGVMFMRDESRFLTWGARSDSRGEVALWDVTNSVPLHVWEHDREVSGVVPAPDDSRILTWTDTSDKVSLWDMTQATPLRTFEHTLLVEGASFNHDGSRVLSWSDDGAVKLWNVAHAEPVQVWNGSRGVIGAVFTRDESHVLVWTGRFSQTGELSFYDVTRAERVQVWKHDHEVNGAVFSRDESRILTWSGRSYPIGKVTLWDVTKSDPIQVWKHDGGINGAMFTRDESHIVTWNADGFLKSWDAALRPAELSASERIVELQVRSATRLDSAGQLVPLTFDEWLAKVQEGNRLP